MITLTLVYPDGRHWIVGGFPSVEASDAWLAEARKQPDWDSSTHTLIEQVPIPSPMV